MDESTAIEDLSETELWDLVGKPERKTKTSRADALKELSGRQACGHLSCEKTFTKRIARYVSNQRTAPALRAAATVALGKVSYPNQQRALYNALKSEDATVVKRAAVSLGRTGDPDAIAKLEELRLKPKHPAAAAINFAKSLISYRHGVGTHLLRPTACNHYLKVDGCERQVFEPKRLGPVKLKKELAAASSELDAILPIYKKRAWTFDCGVHHYLLVFNREFTDPSFLPKLKTQNAVAAVLLDLDGCSGIRYVSEYLLANPARSGSGSIVGVRSIGIAVHAGQFTLGEKRVEFSLHTSNTVHARAIHFEGVFDQPTKSLDLSKAIILVGDASKQAKPVKLKSAKNP